MATKLLENNLSTMHTSSVSAGIREEEHIQGQYISQSTTHPPTDTGACTSNRDTTLNAVRDTWAPMFPRLTGQQGDGKSHHLEPWLLAL